VAVKIVYPFDPDDLEANQPPFVEELVSLLSQGHQAALDEIVKMVANLKQQGRESRYLKKLEGYPLWELKSRSRGGDKGGARVYLFIGPDTTFFLCHAEYKSESEAAKLLLEDTAYIATAFQQGKRILPSRERKNDEIKGSKNIKGDGKTTTNKSKK
jgi:hypothetical protein